MREKKTYVIIYELRNIYVEKCHVMNELQTQTHVK